ncbi:MAG: four helix bundle protein [Alphaproteobacteria bacterium]|nr:four helix bundle protein [Alphaproteobacteria bacterium]
MRFHFEKLDAYAKAIAMVVCIDSLASDLPPGRAYIRDQIRRSANSVVLNLAEGAGEFSPAEKARFYRIAKRSATETAAQLTVMEELGLVRDTKEGRELLHRVVSMLVKMIATAERSRLRPHHTGTGTGTGTGR